jgi:hypothetical protein
MQNGKGLQRRWPLLGIPHQSLENFKVQCRKKSELLEIDRLEHLQPHASPLLRRGYCRQLRACDIIEVSLRKEVVQSK